MLTALLSGLESPAKELIEVLLLERCESSTAFAHKAWYFLSSFAPTSTYTSELCGSATLTRGIASQHPTPLLHAVEVHGAIAAARRTRFVRTASSNLRGDCGSGEAAAPVLSTRDETVAVSNSAGVAASVISEAPQVVEPAEASTSLMSAPPSTATMSAELAHLLDVRTQSVFLRLRANIVAVAGVDSARQRPADRVDASINSFTPLRQVTSSRTVNMGPLSPAGGAAPGCVPR